MDSKLIRKIHMDCPICDKTHEVEERTRLAVVTVKGDKVEYEQRYLFCGNAGEEDGVFETGEMNNENLHRARNAYRVKHGLLTSDDIVGIREGYGLSQVDLARILGWGEATISRYESKAIQDESYDYLLRLINDNPLVVLEFYNKNKSKIAESKQMDVYARIVKRLEAHGKEYLTRQAIEGEYVSFVEPSDSNGLTTLDVDKIEAAISYIAESVTSLYKVKLMKMLWYVDVLAYKTNGKAITGMVYRHSDMGALPVGHYALMNLEKLNVREEESVNYDSMIHVYPTPGMNYSVFSKKEKSVIDRVIDKFKDYKTKDIVKYMHEETAYKQTSSGEIIPFSLAATIREWE